MANPVLIGMIIGGLAEACKSLVGRVLIALGIGFITYQGVEMGMDAIKAAIFSNLDGLPSEIIGILAILNIGKAINVIFSAIASRLALNGLTSVGAKKMVFK